MNVKMLYKGCKIRPVRAGGFAAWYPFITFIQRNNDRKSTVMLANGHTIDSFNVNGWMDFELVPEENLENK